VEQGAFLAGQAACGYGHLTDCCQPGPFRIASALLSTVTFNDVTKADEHTRLADHVALLEGGRPLLCYFRPMNRGAVPVVVIGRRG